MKTLIFGGLVLGSITYLIGTQSDLFSAWVDDIKPHAEQVLVESQKQPRSVIPDSIKARNEINTDALIKTLNEKVSQLEEHIIRLNENALLAKPLNDGALEYEGNDTISQLNNVPRVEQKSIENTSIRTVEGHAQNKPSPYMPVNERSEALIALMNRMEMKAANF